MYPHTPEEYQEEMMRLYRAAHPAPEPTPKPKPMPEPEPTPNPTPAPEPMPNPTPTPEPMPNPTPAPKPMPEPQTQPEPIPAPAQPEQQPHDIPEAGPAPAAQQDLPQERQQAQQTAIGWLQVITRSAGNAMALPGVSVLITNGTGKQMKLEHVAITNESGETEKIALPVPAASLSLDQDEKRQPYSTYDVSVYASGYYRQLSENVPVFAGITSRQIFSMIPLVSDLQEPPETIIFQNNEPNL